MHKLWPLLCFGAACASDPDPSALRATMERRLQGDRTGACVALALITRDGSERSTVCAGDRRAPENDEAFEIGSVTKTMTGFLIASLIDEGKLALRDPLELHLPAGTNVPRFQDEPIRIEHLLTHSAGLPPLPSRMRVSDPSDPYASLTVEQLFGSLADVQLREAPGTTWAYSNFGYMLLSYIASTRGGADIEAMLQQRLYAPLGMRAFVAQRPDGVNDAQGHLALGIAAAPWTFPPQLAGIGGVHATLDDMIRYAQAALGVGDAATVATITRTSAVLRQASGGPTMGMGWIHEQVGGHALLLHDGGTGGFSSLIAVERESGRAVVALSDTALSDTGGLTELALHALLPDDVPLALPRKLAVPEPALRSELAGRYTLGELDVVLAQRGDKLFLQAAGQGEVELGYDSYGDFFPTRAVDAVLTPVRSVPMTFDWKQGGGVVRAVRSP